MLTGIFHQLQSGRSPRACGHCLRALTVGHQSRVSCMQPQPAGCPDTDNHNDRAVPPRAWPGCSQCCTMQCQAAGPASKLQPISQRQAAVSTHRQASNHSNMYATGFPSTPAAGVAVPGDLRPPCLGLAEHLHHQSAHLGARWACPSAADPAPALPSARAGGLDLGFRSLGFSPEPSQEIVCFRHGPALTKALLGAGLQVADGCVSLHRPGL